MSIAITFGIACLLCVRSQSDMGKSVCSLQKVLPLWAHAFAFNEMTKQMLYKKNRFYVSVKPFDETL